MRCVVSSVTLLSNAPPWALIHFANCSWLISSRTPLNVPAADMVRPLKICFIGRLLVVALRVVMGFVATFLDPAV